MQNKDTEIYLSKYIDELKQDPVLAATEILGVYLAPHERVALRGMWEHNWSYLVWGRGAGKTFTDAVFSGVAAVLLPGTKIVIIGPGFRQAQLVFKELETMADNSSTFRDCIVNGKKGVSHGTSEWSMTFKNGSTILAVPLGTDGAKIRGIRAHILIVDEMVQVPKDIIDRVVLPFMATNKNPMAHYLGIEEEGSTNKLIYSTSAYYKFSHGYERFCEFIKECYQNENKDYFVTQFNYKQVPEGFINMKVLEMSRSQISTADFMMEWEAEWVSDTAGFYPASLIAQVGDYGVFPELKGKPGCDYVLGVDPASTFNTCGFAVIKVGSPFKLVYSEALSRATNPEICSRILDFMSKFNIVRISIDRGASSSILDLFSEGRPIINQDGVMRKEVLLPLDAEPGLEGRRIFHVVPATSESVTEINFTMKAAMEAGNIKWPAIAGDFDPDSILERERVLEEIKNLEAEYRMVESSQTRSGWYSFSVPSHKNKDRYSASLFALAGAKAYLGKETIRRILPVGFFL
jgi:hypothetical protein